MSSSTPVSRLIEESLALERTGDVTATLKKASQAFALARTLDDPAAQIEGASQGKVEKHAKSS